MFCCTLLYVYSSIAIILIGKRELFALPYLSSWCLVMVERLFLVVPLSCLRFLIVVLPDNTHLLFLAILNFIFSIFMDYKFLQKLVLKQTAAEFTDLEALALVVCSACTIACLISSKV